MFKSFKKSGESFSLKKLVNNIYLMAWNGKYNFKKRGRKTLAGLLIASTLIIPTNQFSREKYAVLISGSDEYAHYSNLSLAYQVLLENGFKKDNICILNSNGGWTPLFPISRKASKSTVKGVFQELKKKVYSEDMLFIYVTGHGDTIRVGNQKVAAVCLPPSNRFDSIPEYVNELDLKKYVEDLNLKKGIFVFQQCFGGNFAKNLANGKYLTISASGPNELSWYGPWTGKDFSDPFFVLMRYPSLIDRNHDGKISMYELFNEAKFKNPWGHLENPHLYYCGDPNKVFLSE